MSDQKTTQSDNAFGFQQQLAELEQIVDWFESEEADVDQALEKFKRGMELVSELETWLKEAENTVQEITQTFDQDSSDESDANEEPS